MFIYIKYLYINIKYIYVNAWKFSKYILCVYLYMHTKYTPYTYILCKQFLFWMRFNRLTAYKYMYM